MKPTFERCADTTLEKVRATYAERGQEYADSWSEECLVTTFTAATLRAFGLELSPEQMRLLQAAALVDVKDSRMAGAFKADSVIDGVAYRACWLTLMEEYERAHNALTRR